MLAQYLFDSISRLISSRWARDHSAHHGSCENAYAARIGFLHLEVNHCFVLEHDDAFITVRIPLPVWRERRILWGKLHLGYVICLGEDEIRQPGFYARWWPPVPKVVYGQACPPDDDDYFPF